MCRVDIVANQSEIPGIKLRKGTDGPELSMVASFADMLHARYSSMGGASRILIVYEPLVDSGYPDLVVLRYTQTFMKHWDDTRCKLGNTDLKVLSFLLSNHASTEGIAKTLGFSAKAIDASISRLAESSLVFKKGNEWKSYKRDRVFGIKEIVSYEAKMQSASCVHRQAVMNKRFSSSSYAILFSKRPTTTTKSLFAKTGIGLLADGGRSKVIAPQQNDLPKNYVTLRFNEWVGRCLWRGTLV